MCLPPLKWAPSEQQPAEPGNPLRRETGRRTPKFREKASKVAMPSDTLAGKSSFPFAASQGLRWETCRID
jgi:hypothetical protein